MEMQDDFSFHPEFTSFATRLFQHVLFKEDREDGSCTSGFTRIGNEEAALRLITLIGSCTSDTALKSIQAIIRNTICKTPVPYKVVIHLKAQDRRVVALAEAAEQAVEHQLKTLQTLSTMYDQHNNKCLSMPQPPPPLPPKTGNTESNAFRVNDTIFRIMKQPTAVPRMGTSTRPRTSAGLRVRQDLFENPALSAASAASNNISSDDDVKPTTTI